MSRGFQGDAIVQASFELALEKFATVFRHFDARKAYQTLPLAAVTVAVSSLKQSQVKVQTPHKGIAGMRNLSISTFQTVVRQLSDG